MESTEHEPVAERGHGRGARRMASIVLPLVLVILAAAYFHERQGRQREAQELETRGRDQHDSARIVSAARTTLSPDGALLRLPATTAAWYESTLYSRVNGYVDNWQADLGDRVRRGQILATLSTPELDAELLAAHAHLEADLAQVQVRQAARDFAQTTYERWRDSPIGVVAVQEQDAKRADLEAARAEVLAAQARVSLDRAEVEKLVALTAFKQLRAPIDGVITRRDIDIGNLVNAGSAPASKPLYHLAQDSAIRVFVDVPQELAPRVRPGTAARILASDSTSLARAPVSRTAGAIDPSSRTLRVEIDVANSAHALSPGLYVQVELNVRSDPLPRVPASALLFRSGKPQVAVIGEDGTLALRAIRIARDEGSVVDVAEGLHVGDRVALNLSHQLGDGDRVEAHLIEPSPAPTRPTPRGPAR